MHHARTLLAIERIKNNQYKLDDLEYYKSPEFRSKILSRIRVGSSEHTLLHLLYALSVFMNHDYQKVLLLVYATMRDKLEEKLGQIWGDKWLDVVLVLLDIVRENVRFEKAIFNHPDDKIPQPRVIIDPSYAEDLYPIIAKKFGIFKCSEIPDDQEY